MGISTLNSVENQYLGSWCNGNTTDFGSVILGSNPDDPTISGSEFEVTYSTRIKHAKFRLRLCEEKKSFKVYPPDSATFKRIC